MRAVIQRVKQARVEVDKKVVGAIGTGLLVLLGVGHDDTEKDVTWIVDKIVNLRIFDDSNGVMNLSLQDIGGELLAVSQFTLLGDCKKGRRPSWSKAAAPDKANTLYELFVDKTRQTGIRTATGQFQATMEVSLINDGPVTLVLNSP